MDKDNSGKRPRLSRQALNCLMLVQLIDAASGGYASEAFDILTDDEREDIYNGRKKDEAQQGTTDAD